MRYIFFEVSLFCSQTKKTLAKNEIKPVLYFVTGRGKSNK